MAISDKDIKLLWGRAAGSCSRPGCGIDLTSQVEKGDPFVIGEMAHVIARSPDGPRGAGAGGDDSYANLILLCPTDHRLVDKAPEGAFPSELLHHWKQTHEERVRTVGKAERFETAEQLARLVRLLLLENYQIWKSQGPKSAVANDNPGSNAYRSWELRRVDRIVPNNRRIINAVEENYGLLTSSQAEAFSAFKAHAEAYEEHVYDRLDSYPLFPEIFERSFS